MTSSKKNSPKGAVKVSNSAPALPMMTVSIEMIGPKEAEELLKLNTRNRIVNERHVTSIAGAMLDGTYIPSPQSIAVMSDNTLGDGQHRLIAIMRSGKTFPMVVARNVPVTAREVIDTNFTVRSARHALQIADGVKIGSTASSALTAVVLLKRYARLSGATPAVTVATLRETVRDHGDDVRAVIDVACYGNKMRHASFVGSLAIARKTDPAAVDAFCVCLRDRAGLTKNHPALALRDFVESMRGGGGVVRDEISLKTFAAFDAYRSGRSLAKLYESTVARDKYLAPWRKDVSGT